MTTDNDVYKSLLDRLEKYADSQYWIYSTEIRSGRIFCDTEKQAQALSDFLSFFGEAPYQQEADGTWSVCLKMTDEADGALLSETDLYNRIHDIISKQSDSRSRYFMLDWDEILCHTEDDANALADFLGEVFSSPYNTAYYDPEEDDRNDETNACTGCWMVYPDGV